MTGRMEKKAGKEFAAEEQTVLQTSEEFRDDASEHSQHFQRSQRSERSLLNTADVVFVQLAIVGKT